MQSLTGGRKTVQVAGETVRQIVNNLEKEFPGTRARLCDEDMDDLLPGIAVIVDGETSQLGFLEPVKETSEVHFLPALGGGAA
jgi:molybdopterin synthase sulfur carrier subunit